jgi:WD40 repeat protein
MFDQNMICCLDCAIKIWNMNALMETVQQVHWSEEGIQVDDSPKVTLYPQENSNGFNTCKAPSTPQSIQCLSRLVQHNGAILCLRWSPCGQFLASASDDSLIIIWKLESTSALLSPSFTFDKTTTIPSWITDPSSSSFDSYNFEKYKVVKKLMLHESGTPHAFLPNVVCILTYRCNWRCLVSIWPVFGQL